MLRMMKCLSSLGTPHEPLLLQMHTSDVSAFIEIPLISVGVAPRRNFGRIGLERICRIGILGWETDLVQTRTVADRKNSNYCAFQTGSEHETAAIRMRGISANKKVSEMFANLPS
jgi:hypothetical protein